MTEEGIGESDATRMVRNIEARRARVIDGALREGRPRAERLALFIDFENLVLGATASLPGRAEPVSRLALMCLCNAYGLTTTRRAYADWTDPRFGRYQKALVHNGIDLVQIGRGRMNSTDIRIAVDAMQTLITHPAVEAYVLLIGDSDFSPLISRLREFGKHIIGVSAETAPNPLLVSVCSEYKTWGSLVAQAEAPPRTDQPAKPPPAQPSFALTGAETLLVTAMRQITIDTPTANQLKAKMVQLDPAFNVANYGCKTFRAFLAQLHHRVRTVGHSGHDITLALIDQPDQSPTSVERSLRRQEDC